MNGPLVLFSRCELGLGIFRMLFPLSCSQILPALDLLLFRMYPFTCTQRIPPILWGAL